MAGFTTEQIRNIVLLGHSGSGKTSLADSMFHLAGETTRLGSVTGGTSGSDFEPEEQRRQSSVTTAILPSPWKDSKINVLDAPGYADFAGEMLCALRVADAARSQTRIWGWSLYETVCKMFARDWRAFDDDLFCRLQRHRPRIQVGGADQSTGILFDRPDHPAPRRGSGIRHGGSRRRGRGEWSRGCVYGRSGKRRRFLTRRWTDGSLGRRIVIFCV